MADLFEKFLKNMGPLGKWASVAEGYFVFPKLEGQISNRMKFNGKEVITWSVNDYLGLSNHPSEMTRIPPPVFSMIFFALSKFFSRLSISLC